MAAGMRSGLVPLHQGDAPWRRQPDATSVEVGWRSVSSGEPCARRGALVGCLIRDGGEFAVCRAVVSALPMLGGGWLHALPA